VVVGGFGRIGFELANLVLLAAWGWWPWRLALLLVAGSGRFASNSQIWFWLAALGLVGRGRVAVVAVGGFGRIGFELANLVLAGRVGLVGLGRVAVVGWRVRARLASNSQIWFLLAAWGWWPWAVAVVGWRVRADWLRTRKFGFAGR
jgi:hypothetical protein